MTRVTPEIEHQVYRAAIMRDLLTNKALAEQFNLSEKTIKNILERQRERAREVGRNGPMEIETAAV